MKPTAMLFRNLLAMDVEESIRAYGIDGVVLLGGCDKTTPGQIMGAASVDLPSIVVSSGPMLNGKFKGQDIGSGTDVWKFSEAVRAGAQDPLLRALVSPSRTPVEPGEVSGAARFAHQLIASRASGAAITEAPPTPIWAARLAFAASVEAGDLDAAERKLPAASQPDPDLIDLLGQDAETGVLFEMAFYDPAFLPALQRYHAGRAWHFAAQLGPAGQALQPVLEAAWGGPLPAAITEAALPAAELPAWAAVFLSTSPTPGDLRARFADRPGDRWASRAAAATGDSPSDVVDGELRAAAALEPSFSATLQSGAEGSLARDLQFGLLLSDALLRGRMAQMLATGNAPQALRLARRSADPNPGSLGGAANSAATRVSHRNDRAFLLRLAGCLWSAGQPGQALDFAHPLAQEHPALQPVVHYLGQLDAAASIGLHGKANQL